MQIKKICVIFLILIFVSGSLAPDIFAQSPVRKLGRGIANTFTGFLELPANIASAAEEEGYIAAVTYGVVKGLALSVLRTGIGLYETFSFLIPLPWGYEPIIEPEFMMGEDSF